MRTQLTGRWPEDEESIWDRHPRRRRVTIVDPVRAGDPPPRFRARRSTRCRTRWRDDSSWCPSTSADPSWPWRVSRYPTAALHTALRR